VRGAIVAALLAGCIGDIGDGGTGPASTQQGLCADTPFARRLTVAEYVATVEAALGVDIALEAEAGLPPDLRTDGFSNTAGSLIVTIDHVETYAEIAQQIVAALDVEALIAQHASCSDFSADCEREIVANLGEHIYRGPLSELEIDAIVPLFDTVATEGESFAVATGLVLETMLQSPRFLYRLEREQAEAPTRALDGYELASRLSFLLWGASPDEALYQAAASGLGSEAAIVAHVERMLDDPRARATSLRYLRDWLNLDRLDNLARDPARFPDWDPELGRLMKAETLAFFEHLVWDEQRPLGELFNAQRTFVAPALAEHYGFGGDGEVDLSSIPERGGLLTQGSISTIGGNSESMVGRGLFLLENILCGHVDSPPPGVDTTPPEAAPGKSQRSYSEERVNNSSCSGCHRQMEPQAWGLERFDATGFHRLEDAYGNALAEDGWVSFPGRDAPVSYDTSAELMDLLADSSEIRACFAAKSAQFAYGRPLGQVEDGCLLGGIQQSFEASSFSYRELMLAIATSAAFRTIHTQNEEVAP
jgi:hypothetical protein